MGIEVDMYCIFGIVFAVFFLLFLWSAHKGVPKDILSEEKTGLLTPFCRIGYLIYCFWEKRTGNSSQKKKIQKQLEQLNPYKDINFLTKVYYVKKLGLSLAIIFCGTIFGALLKYQSEQASALDGNIVHRGSYRQEARKVQLEAALEDSEKLSFEIEVKGQAPEQEEADELESLFWEKVRGEILGDNFSLKEVWTDLNLVEGLEGYPFEIQWSSSRPDLLDDYGWTAGLEEGRCEEVSLSAKVYLGDLEWDHELSVTLIAPVETDEVKQYEDLVEYIKLTEKQSVEEAYLELPSEWDGRKIKWREKKDDNSMLFWSLALLAAAAVFLGGDQDLRGKVAERQQQIKEVYPSIVDKMVLYLGAGMNVRGAMSRIADSYKRDLASGKKVSPGYEELVYTCRELQTGVSEAVAYENMGIRNGLQEFVRLGAILSQNAKKGNRVLLERLQEEADRTRKEQRNYYRQRGETVSTKLLVPMVMMLGIIMVMIMIPAFGSF